VCERERERERETEQVKNLISFKCSKIFK
jgi:hypothetical protein